MSGWHRDDFTALLGTCLAAWFVVGSASARALPGGEQRPALQDQPALQPKPALQQTTSTDTRPRSRVLLSLEGAWPDSLLSHVREDVVASLAERGIEVRGPSPGVAPASVGPDGETRGVLRIYPPDGARRFRVVVEDVQGQLVAQREVSLHVEHPDTWSVAIAAAADELLAAAWRLPPRGSSSAAEGEAMAAEGEANGGALEAARGETESTPRTSPLAPPSTAPVDTRSSTLAPTRRGGTVELGVAGAAERYFPNAWAVGGDVFVGVPVNDWLIVEVGLTGRQLLERESPQGDVTGRTAGLDAYLNGVVSRAASVHFGGLVGFHGSVLWFDAAARDGALASAVVAQLLVARAGGVVRVDVAEALWLGVRATAGIPLVRAEARDSFGAVLRLAGVEGAARVEVGWRL